MLVFSSFLAFPPWRNDVCSRTNIASVFFSIFFFSRSLSKIHKCNHQRTLIKRMCMTQSNVLPHSDSIKKRIHKAKREKKRKNLSIERHSRLFSICLCCNNLEQLFELVVVVLNEILLLFSKQCVLSFFLFYLPLIPRLHTHFSHAICCSNIHLRRSNPERTLNCNDGKRDSIYIYEEENENKEKKKEKNGLHFYSRINAKTEERSLL